MSKMELLQGTLDVMVLQTLATMGALHGYGIARRIERHYRRYRQRGRRCVCVDLPLRREIKDLARFVRIDRARGR